MQIKITIRFHYTFVRIARMEKTIPSVSHAQEWEGTGTFSCTAGGWEWKGVQPRVRKSWTVSYKVNMHITCPATPVLGVSSREKKAYIETKSGA